jgi:NAD(P)-dependent dehydrogenase (short-subunit alcohol dehydrogenase family)
MKNILVTGINSDIGEAMVRDILEKHNNFSFYGTFHKHSKQVNSLRDLGCRLFQVDMSDQQQVEQFAHQACGFGVNSVVFLHGSLHPIGRFSEVSFQDWKNCQYVNALSILHILNIILPSMRSGGRVLSLAGGGVNSAPINFSAYTSAKITLLKMTEILAAEYPDISFFNLGPGFVKTKIHTQTLTAGHRAGAAFIETKRRLDENDFVSMDKVVKAIYFLLLKAPTSYSGRNFSAENDSLSSTDFARFISSNLDFYKLRKFGCQFSNRINAKAGK